MIQLNLNTNTIAPLRCKTTFIICVFGLLIVSTLVDVVRAQESDEYIEDNNTDASHDWDILIFTQSWPLTTCFHWKEEDKSHKCNLPSEKDFWTIHGIWPTKLESFGPNFCNNSAKFDLDKLEPIVDQMNVIWPNIETGTEYDSLWKHEYIKHGTCAATIEQLNDELKYFDQGLLWHSKGFFMSEVLAKAGIHPDSNHTVTELSTGVVNILGKNPSIHCLYDNKNDISFLAEIRICFDKSLQLIDCDGVRFDQISFEHAGGVVNTNCHVSKPIFYPSNVPPLEMQNPVLKNSDERDTDVNTAASHDWDILIFTQSWPVTTCFHWKEENKNNECNLPKKEFWTIHGIWPTKLESFGPQFCNNSAKFDMNKLDPIVNEMYVLWPNIETNTDYDYLWKHEWLKHGTCAAAIEQLDDELKYFDQGLLWHSKGFFMSEVLAKAGIHPDSNHTVTELSTGVVNVLGKNPFINCLYDSKHDISYLSEIRICFDKTLQLVDCDGIRFDQVSFEYSGGRVNTNCHASKPVFYPSNVPPLEEPNRIIENSDEYIDEYDTDVNANASHDWDILIFSQSWPVTTCLHWKEENKNNECNLPSRKEFWTIHGIWPTKLESFGPSFCNNSATFDIDKLDPIVDQMYMFWPNIEEGTDYDSLWKHEYIKHGTCAAAIEELDDELKYFDQGLLWHSKGFFMSEVLAKAGIHPDSNHTITGLYTGVVKVLGKNPSIHCLYDSKNDISYLAEIRICFDKSLQLIDCDGVRFHQVSFDYSAGKVNTNCHVSKPIFYPSNVPPLEKQIRRRKDTWKFPIVNVYKLVQFLIWCTL